MKLLTPYSRVMLMLGVSLVVVILGADAIKRLLIPPFDPFSAFADIFPDMPESALEGRGFSCEAGVNNIYHDTSQKYCQLTFSNGTFSSIEITTKGATISQTTFVLRESILLGDLALFLGTRDFRVTPHSAFFSWQGHVGLASTVDGTRRLFSAISQVTFTNAPS